VRFAFALLIGLALSCGEDRVQPAPVAATRTSSATAAQGPTAGAGQDLQLIDGDAVLDPLRDGKLRGLVVNVWASWCGSCKEEIPILLGLRKSFAAEGIDFAFVSADEPQAFPEAVSLMRSWNGPFPVLAVGGASIKSFKRAMHPEWKGAIPATFLFDGARKLRHFWEGPIVEQEIAPILQGLLAGEAIDGVTRTTATPREMNR
jgi:thiol-disulfide isomerase/thioredoxin